MNESAFNSTTRFSNRVDNYVKYRPHYPAAVIDYLKKENVLNDNSVIADIGSGTGTAHVTGAPFPVLYQP
jgi:hypothetical protein